MSVSYITSFFQWPISIVSAQLYSALSETLVLSHMQCDAYRLTGAENLTGTGVSKIGMPGPGLTLVFNFIINLSSDLMF